MAHKDRVWVFFILWATFYRLKNLVLPFWFAVTYFWYLCPHIYSLPLSPLINSIYIFFLQPNGTVFIIRALWYELVLYDWCRKKANNLKFVLVCLGLLYIFSSSILSLSHLGALQPFVFTSTIICLRYNTSSYLFLLLILFFILKKKKSLPAARILLQVFLLVNFFEVVCPPEIHSFGPVGSISFRLSDIVC